MVPMSRYALMGGTVAAAIGIGYFMQMSPTAQARYGNGVEVASLTPTQTVAAITAPDASPVPRPMTDVPVTDGSTGDSPTTAVAALDMSEPETATPVPLADLLDSTDAAPVEMAAITEGEGPGAAPLSEPAPDCEAAMTAVAQPAAMVDLTLTSCQPGQRVTIHHNGMMLQGQTDTAGAMRMTVPALAETALFIAEFPNRDGAVAEVQVTSFVDYDRVVLQWRGAAGFALAAFEFDAGFGTDGHRHAGQPGSVTEVVQGLGGVITQHGDAGLDNGLRAEAYTFPRGMAQRSGTVAFSVEAEVTAANCGREIAAQSLQITGGTDLAVRELTLEMPDCTATGDYIVLKNMAEDLTIAAN